MGRKRSEISIIPFNQTTDAMAVLLPTEAQFYLHD